MKRLILTLILFATPIFAGDGITWRENLELEHWRNLDTDKGYLEQWLVKDGPCSTELKNQVDEGLTLLGTAEEENPLTKEWTSVYYFGLLPHEEDGGWMYVEGWYVTPDPLQGCLVVISRRVDQEPPEVKPEGMSL